jgi:4-amino-4-deoxy-L-arabinose transferase-like glycosyltransferase
VSRRLIVLLWLALTVPAVFIRGAHYEEGTTIALARGAFEDGHWLEPHAYGVRTVERPVLLSWVLGGIGAVVGRLDLWVVRLPAVGSILGGALLVFWIVRRHATPRAAGFGAACFLVSPMMLQKSVTAEPDGFVSVLLIAALLAWWNGCSSERMTVTRVLGIGLLLTLAGLAKGPQPLAYFFLGTSAFLVWRRRWRSLPHLAVIAVPPAVVLTAWYLAVYRPGDLTLWLVHSRVVAPASAASWVMDAGRLVGLLALELLPGLIVAIPLAAGVIRDRAGAGDRDLAALLLCYASACTAVLLLWPGARGRYAMPAVLAVAALAGLGFDRHVAPLFRMRLAARLVTGALLGYGVLVNGVLMPARPEWFRVNTAAAERIQEAMSGRPGWLFVDPGAALRNVTATLPAPIREVSADALPRLDGPAWVLVAAAQEQRLRRSLPHATLMPRLDLSPGVGARLIAVGDTAPGASAPAP